MTAPKTLAALGVVLLLASSAAAQDESRLPSEAFAQDRGAGADALAQGRRCLSRDQQRAALTEGRALPLATVRRNLRQRIPGELVRVRLCQDGERLIYLLTVLPRDGKVRRATVDAANGAVIAER
jgi:uncharacterized membrane protein YkoI